ncbi:glycosyltransferase family 2 protein [Myroides odoratimimus]|uniref:glycosyltransferase family 2 protein n=1 Tax=Myroides odoratimimus TaxID=76832 RepID=UPI0025751E32|nr:glycosyltransferase family 2 protein [Myroides odoratimimus]MDM1521195.1 glycosyltransferase family 2 protein [Myroides odoratimimus]
MKSKFLSIVIPIYNVENYLRRCLTSISESRLDNFEVIMVDDGSPDNSVVICQEFEQNDSRFKLFRKKNGGLSDARNFGFLHVDSDFVWFIDSDDFLQENSIDKVWNILNTIGSIDILLFNYSEFFEFSNQRKEIRKFNNEQGILRSDSLIKKYNTYGIQAWTQVYSVDFLKKNQLFFEKGYIYEDVLFNLKAYSCNPNIYVIEDVLYNYVQRDGSIMNSNISDKNIRSLIKILELINNEGIRSNISLNFLGHRQHYYLTTLFSFLKAGNFSEDYIKLTLSHLTSLKLKAMYRELDTVISKKIKKRMLSDNNFIIYKYWKQLFNLIRFENFLNKL